MIRERITAIVVPSYILIFLIYVIAILKLLDGCLGIA